MRVICISGHPRRHLNDYFVGISTSQTTLHGAGALVRRNGNTLVQDREGRVTSWSEELIRRGRLSAARWEDTMKLLKAAGLAFGFVLASNSLASAAEIKFMTGPQGGAWIPLGGQLKDLWEKQVANVSVQALPGAGIANVRGVQEDKTDLGFGNSISTVDAIAGRPPFNKPHTNVCNLATLYPQYFQVVVRADAGVNSIKELKGRSITTQPRGNTAEEITKQLLQVNGLTYNDLKVSFLSYTDAVTQVQDGHAVAFFAGTTIPSSAVMDLATSRDIKILDLADQLDAMKKVNSGYTLNTIPKGTYPKQDRDTRVIGYATHIVASCKLPEDVVYGMTKVIAQNTQQLASIVKDIGRLTPQGMGEDIGVPFHAGAAKFYKEAGIAVKVR
jgi:TRAP transporter TAXI family solute receptor